MNIAELFALATLIKNETGVDKNTATRIGTLFNEILEKINEGGGGEGSGVQVITIANLTELDALPQGVYLINGAAEGLLVVVEQQSDYTITAEFNTFIALTNESIPTSVAKSVMLTFKYKGAAESALGKGLVYPDDGVGFPLSDSEVAALSLAEYNQYLTRAINDTYSYIATYQPNYVGVTIPTTDAVQY